MQDVNKKKHHGNTRSIAAGQIGFQNYFESKKE